MAFGDNLCCRNAAYGIDEIRTFLQSQFPDTIVVGTSHRLVTGDLAFDQLALCE